jgi:hypothetical protein
MPDPNAVSSVKRFGHASPVRLLQQRWHQYLPAGSTCVRYACALHNDGIFLPTYGALDNGSILDLTLEFNFCSAMRAIERQGFFISHHDPSAFWSSAPALACICSHAINASRIAAPRDGLYGIFFRTASSFFTTPGSTCTPIYIDFGMMFLSILFLFLSMLKILLQYAKL